MKKNILLLSFIVILIWSCSKEDEQTGYLEPIAVLTPAANPSSTITGSFIDFKAVLTNDEYIDSAQVFIQSDSAGKGYNASNDSLVYKVVWPVGAQKNIQTIEGKTLPAFFPVVGKNIYLTFKFNSKTKYPTKTVKLEVR